MEKRDVTKEEVKGFRKGLDEKLYDWNKKIDRAKRRAEELSHVTYLD